MQQKRDDMLRRYILLSTEQMTEEKMAEMGKMRGIYYRSRTIRSGSLLEVQAYPLVGKDTAKSIRKIEISPEAIKAHNQTEAERRLTRLLETNFTDEDYYFTGTFEGEELPTLEKVHKEVKRFIARMNYERKKRSLESAKYIYVMEGYEEGSRQKRLHFHMVVDGGLDRAEIKRIWGNGRSKCDELDPKAYGGLIGLAKYISKDPRGRKRWVSSKKLKKPTVTVANRKIRLNAAYRIAQNRAEASVALEKLYPGYDYVDMEVKQNPYIPGCYIYAIMRKKEEKKNEQGHTHGIAGNGTGKRTDRRRYPKDNVPDRS